MIDFFRSGGYAMWPILVAGLIVLGLSLDSGRKLLRSPGYRREEIRSGIDAILFWGCFAAVVGVLGTVVGIIQMSQAIERAGEVAAALVWSGFGVTLTTTLFGLLVLSAALLLWFALWTRLRARSAPEAAA